MCSGSQILLTEVLSAQERWQCAVLTRSWAGLSGQKVEDLKKRRNPLFSRKGYCGRDIVEKEEETHTVFVVIVQICHSLGVLTVLVHCICEQNRNRKRGLIDGSVLHQRALSPLEGFSERSETRDRCHSAQVRHSSLSLEAGLGRSRPLVQGNSGHISTQLT